MHRTSLSLSMHLTYRLPTSLRITVASSGRQLPPGCTTNSAYQLIFDPGSALPTGRSMSRLVFVNRTYQSYCVNYLVFSFFSNAMNFSEAPVRAKNFSQLDKIWLLVRSKHRQTRAARLWQGHGFFRLSEHGRFDLLDRRLHLSRCSTGSDLESTLYEDFM